MQTRVAVMSIIFEKSEIGQDLTHCFMNTVIILSAEWEFLIKRGALI